MAGPEGTGRAAQAAQEEEGRGAQRCGELSPMTSSGGLTHAGDQGNGDWLTQQADDPVCKKRNRIRKALDI